MSPAFRIGDALADADDLSGCLDTCRLRHLALGEGHATEAPDVEIVQRDGANPDLDLAGSGRRRRIDLLETEVAVAMKLEGTHGEVNLSKLVWPGSRGVEHGQDFDATITDAIGENIGDARQHEFACPVFSPRTADIRMIGQHRSATLDHGDRCRCSGATITLDERKNLIGLPQRAARPNDFQVD